MGTPKLILGRVIQYGATGDFAAGVRMGSHRYSPRCEGSMRMTSSTDPFSASIIPFEVPEQMRAFAEKGVSQARDSYAKFKDAAETHNGTIEAVFTSATKGASAYSAKLLEFFKANTTSSLDFAQELFGVKTPAAAHGAVDLARPQAVRDVPGPGQGARRAQPEGCDRNRRADQGLGCEVLQAGRLIARIDLRKARAVSPGFFCWRSASSRRLRPVPAFSQCK